MMDLFYLVIGIGFVLSFLVQGWLRTTYARWSRVRNSREATGSTVARHVLDQNELWHVTVTLQPGSLTDHYDPRTRTVSLSQRIYQEPSVASAAIAAHECGHAMLDKEAYGPMRLRERFLPVAQLGAQYGTWAIMGGLFLGSSSVVNVGFLMFAASLLFQLMTLPIEFDASRRAKAQLESIGLDSEEDRAGARKDLRAAAMTYVAGSATAMGHLLMILVFAGRGLLRKFAPTHTK
jgi:Zn-dependent membrane protease YugP